jgi:hypothetical protein
MFYSVLVLGKQSRVNNIIVVWIVVCIFFSIFKKEKIAPKLWDKVSEKEHWKSFGHMKRWPYGKVFQI